MIVQDNQNNYIKLATIEDFSFIQECLLDWRPKVYTSEEITESLQRSENFNTNIFSTALFSYSDLVFIYCSNSDEKIGALKAGLRAEDKIMALDIEYVVIHPNHRGSGYFSSFYRMISWFFNRHLKIDKSYFEVLKDVPQVVGATTKLNKETHYNSVTKNNIEKFGAIFKYDTFYEALSEIAVVSNYTAYVPEISYELRSQTNGRSKLKVFNLSWNIDGGIQITRR